MTSKTFDMYLEAAKTRDDVFTVFDCVKNDDEYGNKIRLVYKTFYPNGKVVRNIFHVESPFYPDSIEYEVKESGYARLHLTDTDISGKYEEVVEKEADLVEITIDEIEKRLGFPVKIVKEKKSED